ncbi:MAG TPA: DUF4442 domain-containing protein [Calditrichia bacterium]|nr:DUF4442 domain-containing protein [Calditrichota bacterium]HQV31371.1 DUF4442 domain-containing protein [Calditrichia bacterium]
MRQYLLWLMNRATHSGFHRWLLNLVLWKVIPFNRPHRFWITRIQPGSIEIRMPYRRRNFNHIRGLHACGLATAAEYATGLLLLMRVDPARYRLIMQNLNVTYHYQAKTTAYARFDISEDWLVENLVTPLQRETSVLVKPNVSVFDQNDNLVCEATLSWQVKDWQQVRTRV